MSIKAGCISRDMRMLGRIVEVHSTKQSVDIMVGNPNMVFLIIAY